MAEPTKAGKLIKEYRTSLGLTQASFANTLGVYQSAIAQYENPSWAKKNWYPGFLVLMKIAKHFPALFNRIVLEYTEGDHSEV